MNLVIKKMAISATLMLSVLTSANAASTPFVRVNSDGATDVIFNTVFDGAYFAEFYQEGLGGNYSGDNFGATYLREGRNIFLVFDINLITVPGLSLNNLVSAKLLFGNPKYDLETENVSLSLYDVTTSIDQLIAPQTGRFDIYQDLESGLNYGSLKLPEYDETSVKINVAGLSAIKSSSGLFAIGGSLNLYTDDSTSQTTLYTDEGGGYSLQLTFATPVPESDTYAMLLAGLGIVGAIVRRSRIK